MANRTSALASVDDLRLVVTLADAGSLTAAAAALHIAQPSASQRLKVLERRLGVALFHRHPTGTIPTPAGIEYLTHAKHALATIQAAADMARAATGHDRVRFGTFSSLAVPVFTALERVLPRTTTVEQHVRSGTLLIDDIVRGRVDGAVVALPAGGTSHPGTRRHRLGTDPLMLIAPTGVAMPERTGSQQLSGAQIVLASFSSQPDDVVQLLAQRGGQVDVAATAPIALALARLRGSLAAIPRSCWLADQHDDESALQLGSAFNATLSVVTARPPHPRLTELSAQLAQELCLDTIGAAGGGV